MVDSTGHSLQEISTSFLRWDWSGFPSFDQQTAPSARWEDLDPELVSPFRARHPEDDLRVLAWRVGLLAGREAAEAQPTVAGVLVASRTPERWLPNAFIQAFRLRSREATGHPGDTTDALDVRGPLPVQIANACRYVFDHQDRTPDGFPQYDMPAVFEALVNAALHRDYSIYAPPIRLSLFPDRLEISSPGALAGSMEVELLGYRRAVRNRVINSLLLRLPVPRDAHWMEGAGTYFSDRPGRGVERILARSEAHSGRTPEYRMLGDSELLLTIFAAGRTSPATPVRSRRRAMERGDRQEQVCTAEGRRLDSMNRLSADRPGAGG